MGREMKRNLVISSTLVVCFIFGVILKISPVIVMSGSMEPKIRTGSLCFVSAKAPFENIKVNDVITYDVLEGKITHRVVEKSDSRLITKGDANQACDLGIVTKNNYYGKVIFNVPYAGFFIYYMKKNIIFVYIFFMFIIFKEGTKRKGGRL